MSTNGQYEEVDEDQLAENTQRMCRVANLSEKETRKMLGYCESPIERLFLTQIIYAAEDGIYSINVGNSNVTPLNRGGGETARPCKRDMQYVIPQMPKCRFRL